MNLDNLNQEQFRYLYVLKNMIHKFKILYYAPIKSGYLLYTYCNSIILE